MWLFTKNLSVEDGCGNRKLCPQCCGPFTVIKKINDATLKLSLRQIMLDRTVHNGFCVSLRKPHVDDNFGRTVEPPPPFQLGNREEKIEAEKILFHRRRRKKVQYLVKWMRYPDHENEWSREELSNCQELIDGYHDRRIVNHN